jgi:hypothetical protein
MPLIYRILLLVTILSLFNETSGQTQECGTESSIDPHFNKLKFEIFKTLKLNSTAEKTIINIPIKAHIIRHTNGYGGLSTADLYETINILNTEFDSIGLNFFLCDSIHYWDFSPLYDLYGPTESYYVPIYNDHNALNIYFFNSIISSSGITVGGYAYLPWSGIKSNHYIAMSNFSTTNSTTIIHEVGHFFGLYHTHETTNGVEYVNGSNCAISGDLCCDTPADNYLNLSTVSVLCDYIGNATDSNGDSYTPDVTNIMSYSRSSCKNHLSAEQYNRILYYQVNERNYLSCPDESDISLTNVSLESDIVNINGPLDVSFYQNYIGSKFTYDQAKVKNSYHLSLDSILDLVDDIEIYIDSSDLGIDNPKINIIQKLSIPKGIVAGTYYLIINGDIDQQIIEVNENNNSQTIQVSLIDFLENNITIYPNPVDNYLNYKFDDIKIYKIEVLNNLGQIVFQDYKDFDGKVNLNRLNAGSYFIRFKYDISNSVTLHFLKA